MTFWAHRVQLNIFQVFCSRHKTDVWPLEMWFDRTQLIVMGFGFVNSWMKDETKEKWAAKVYQWRCPDARRPYRTPAPRVRAIERPRPQPPTLRCAPRFPACRNVSASRNDTARPHDRRPLTTTANDRSPFLLLAITPSKSNNRIKPFLYQIHRSLGVYFCKFINCSTSF